MAKVEVYKQNGEKAGTMVLAKEIFEIDLNFDLVHQVMVCQAANRRQGTAHTKDRGEVSGGGKKPWRQKGTGRARHGSIRSPIWIGGGVTFGPRNEKKYKKNIPQKMRRKAMFMVLSAKTNDKTLLVLEEIKIERAKSKLMALVIKDLREKIKDFKKGKILLVLPEMDKKIILASRNLDDLKTMQAKDLNVLDLVSSPYLILTKKAIKKIEETFLNK